MATPSPGTNSLTPPSVMGLEGGRINAAKCQRRRRRKDRATSSVLIATLMGTVAGGGYLGYTIYAENEARQADELERRYAEIQAERAGRTTDDMIDDLGRMPQWNGNAPPDIRAAGDKIEIIAPSP